MAKTVSFHNPDFEDGKVFDVGGLPIPNGGSIELTDEQELEFYSKKQQTVDDYFSGDSLVKVSGKSEMSKSDKAAHTGEDVNAEPVVNDESEDTE